MTTKKAIIVIGGVLAGLWLLERHARASTKPKPGGYDGGGINPGSGVGICVEGDTGPTACGGDFDPRVPTTASTPITPGPLVLIPPNKPASKPDGGPPIFIPPNKPKTWEAALS